jgi:hypothetical protein
MRRSKAWKRDWGSAGKTRDINCSMASWVMAQPSYYILETKILVAHLIVNIQITAMG